MKPILDLPLLGKVPSYMFFAAIGLFIVSVDALYNIIKKDYDIKKFNINHLISLIGLVIGMKTFGMLSVVLNMIYNHQGINLEEILNSGIVFYGGVIGYYITLRLLERKKENQYVFDILAYCYPLFGMIGRIGCFFAGCCYGIESDSFLAIEYERVVNNEIKTRIPVQLLEASADLIIFIIIKILYKKQKLKGKLIYIYFITYGIIRFILEFFRGDTIRGVYGLLSFSQIICIVTIIYSIINLIRNRGREK